MPAVEAQLTAQRELAAHNDAYAREQARLETERVERLRTASTSPGNPIFHWVDERGVINYSTREGH
jgi:hypothetical protein